MKKIANNYAYIDGANLHKGISGLGWKLDYKRFRVWLREKFKVDKAYLFIGLIPSFADLYTRLQEAGFILVYKQVVYDTEGKPKGNCDADLVLHLVSDMYENKFEKAVLVSSDGDYSSTIKFLQSRQKMGTLLSPATQKRCLILLKRTNVPIVYLSDKKGMLMRQNEKAPSGDKTPPGSSS